MNRTKTKQDNLGFTLQAAFNQDLMGKKNQFIAGVGYDYSKIRFNQSRVVNLWESSEFGVASPTGFFAAGDDLADNTNIQEFFRIYGRTNFYT
jgi:hypothetical protein